MGWSVYAIGLTAIAVVIFTGCVACLIHVARLGREAKVQPHEPVLTKPDFSLLGNGTAPTEDVDAR